MANGEKVLAGKDLTELLRGRKAQVEGVAGGVRITKITADSREAGPGVLFVAVAGLRVDGHDFVEQAVAAGCEAVVVQKGRAKTAVGKKPGPVRVVVEDTRRALGELAAAFYDYPANRLRMIAITGTNGKTTTSYLLEGVLAAAGESPGVIGTVNYRYAGLELPAPYTTPEPVQLQQLLWQMAERRTTHVVMEVSSHALAQGRLQGVLFDVALFTNLTRDHLDFHGDMESYFNAKKLLFTEHLKQGATAVVMQEGDEEASAQQWGRRLVRELTEDASWRAANRKVITCGLAAGSDVFPGRPAISLAGIDADVTLPGGMMRMATRLVGNYNLKNVLGCLGVGTALGLEGERMGQALARFAGVPGRLERVGEIDVSRPAVFVDYAHTPDALENVLATLRGLTSGRLVVIFGCGGDRDRGKRPLMGAVAGRLADVVLVTSDNPRSESASAILADIEAGLRGLPRLRGEALLRRPWLRGYDIIESRREAIRVGVQGAHAGDVVLISGKGHECYQIDRSGKRFFDDRLEARQSLAVVGAVPRKEALR